MRNFTRFLFAVLLALIAHCSIAQETPPAGLKAVNGQFYISLPDSAIWQFKGSPYGWQRLARYKDLSSVVQTIPAGPISSSATIGYNPGTNISVSDWITNVFYRSANPTASLTGGATIRITSAATTSDQVSYTYGKQTGTQNIASATVNGSTSGVTQNANGATGNLNVSVPSNSFTTTTYTLLVTTVDSKTASSSTSFTTQNDRFWFRSANAVPDAAAIQAAAGGGSGLSGSRAGTFTITASGSNYPGFAYPSRLGSLTSIKDANNVEVLSGYKTDIISITTAGGYTENYRYYINQNATSGTTIMVTQ